jgi:hypothetical protein
MRRWLRRWLQQLLFAPDESVVINAVPAENLLIRDLNGRPLVAINSFGSIGIYGMVSCDRCSPTRQ